MASVSQQNPPSPETLVSQSAHATDTQWVKNETERVTQDGNSSDQHPWDPQKCSQVSSG